MCDPKVVSWWSASNRKLRQDEHIRPFVQEYGKEGLVCRGDLFYTLCRSIVGQQISVTAADAIWGRLETAAKRIKPRSVLKLDESQLRTLGLSRMKASYLLGIADAMPEFRKVDWDDLDDEAAILRLIELRGVGRWTAEMVLIFAFAASINTFLLYQQVPQQLLAVLQGTVDSRGEFLLFSNLLMLFAGLLLDGTSALLVTSSLLEPLAQSFGITSVHYATMLVLNLGLGCLLPPAGTILLAAMTVFEAGFIQVVRAVIPVIGILLTALVVVTLVPGISNFL